MPTWAKHRWQLFQTGAVIYEVPHISEGRLFVTGYSETDFLHHELPISSYTQLLGIGPSLVGREYEIVRSNNQMLLV